MEKQNNQGFVVKLKIKKGSVVEVIAGSDKGKRGTVIEVNPKDLEIKVQGVRVQKRHDRKEGIKEREGFIHYSNVKMVEAAKASGKKSSK